MESPVNHSEREHARYSPSSLESREICPGWENAEEKEPAQWATDGEKCHEAAEAKIGGDDSLHQALPKDLSSFVQEVYDYVQPRIAGAEKIVAEQRLHHAQPLLREYCHGTPDLYTITGNAGQIFDYKFGRRPVTNANTNLQGWAYVLALFDTYPQLNVVEMHFIVPRVHNCTSDALFERSDYDRLLGRILRAVERCTSSESELNPCWSACAYCGRKAECHALTTMVRASYDLETKEFSYDALVDASGREDAASLGYLLNASKVVEDWVKQTQERIKQKALEGNEVSGYELRFTRGRTSVKTIDKVIAAVPNLTVEQLIPLATVPLAELKKLYATSTGAENIGNSEKELWSKLSTGGALSSGNEVSYLHRTNENN